MGFQDVLEERQPLPELPAGLLDRGHIERDRIAAFPLDPLGKLRETLPDPPLENLGFDQDEKIDITRRRLLSSGNASVECGSGHMGFEALSQRAFDPFGQPVQGLFFPLEEGTQQLSHDELVVPQRIEEKGSRSPEVQQGLLVKGSKRPVCRDRIEGKLRGEASAAPLAPFTAEEAQDTDLRPVI